MKAKLAQSNKKDFFFTGVAVIRMSSVSWNTVLLLVSTNTIADQNILIILDFRLLRKTYFEYFLRLMNIHICLKLLKKLLNMANISFLIYLRVNYCSASNFLEGYFIYLLTKKNFCVKTISRDWWNKCIAVNITWTCISLKVYPFM